MADEQLLALLRKDVTEWNKWKISNSGHIVDLRGAHLPAAHLSGADLSDANLRGAVLTNASLMNAKLPLADLRDADLRNADLRDADLRNADLTGAVLHSADLTGADLRGAVLRSADLTGADLTHADLSGADLIHAHLTRADLTGADLSSATLNRAHLSGAQLRGANLSGTRLTFANLNGAHLSGTNLSGAILIETVLANVNLSKASGLRTCKHFGPSIVDHRTLLLSGQSIPLEFLRGCGLPDRLIHYMPSLLEAGPIQFYSCFISYSTANQDFADRLYADLQNKGVRCWFAPHDMRGGKRIHDQIDEAIRNYDRLLLILSPESMSSTWVSTEISKARQKEIAARRSVLFPITLVPFESIRDWKQFDADIGDDSAKRIREYFVPDFSQWKNHDAYQQSFELLLKALQSQD